MPVIMSEIHVVKAVLASSNFVRIIKPKAIKAVLILSTTPVPHSTNAVITSEIQVVIAVQV